MLENLVYPRISQDPDLGVIYANVRVCEINIGCGSGLCEFQLTSERILEPLEQRQIPHRVLMDEQQSQHRTTR